MFPSLKALRRQLELAESQIASVPYASTSAHQQVGQAQGLGQFGPDQRGSSPSSSASSGVASLCETEKAIIARLCEPSSMADRPEGCAAGNSPCQARVSAPQLGRTFGPAADCGAAAHSTLTVGSLQHDPTACCRQTCSTRESPACGPLCPARPWQSPARPSASVEPRKLSAGCTSSPTHHHSSELPFHQPAAQPWPHRQADSPEQPSRRYDHDQAYDRDPPEEESDAHLIHILNDPATAWDSSGPACPSYPQASRKAGAHRCPASGWGSGRPQSAGPSRQSQGGYRHGLIRFSTPAHPSRRSHSAGLSALRQCTPAKEGSLRPGSRAQASASPRGSQAVLPCWPASERKGSQSRPGKKAPVSHTAQRSSRRQQTGSQVPEQLAQALKLADQWRTKCASQELRIAGQMETVHALEDSSKQQAAALEAVQAELATKAEALEGARAALVHTRAALQREQQEAAGQAALVMGQAKKREAQLQAQNAFLESQLSELKQQAARGRERESSLLEAAKRAAADRAGLAGTAAAACTAATDAEHSLLQLQKRMASLQRTLHQEKKNREDLELKLAKAAAGCEKLHRDLSAARQARRMGEAERRSTAASLEACRQQAEAAQRQVADLRQQNEALKASLKQASMRQFKVTEDNSRLRQRNAHQRQRLQDLLHTRHDSGTDSEESETPDWVQLPGGGAGTDHSQLALNTYYAYSHAARPKSAPPKAAPLAGAGKQPAEKTERHKHAKERGRTAPTRSGDQRMLAMRAPRPRSKTGSGQGRS